jgi:VIT1/CCC1 family predicted Fe2+/Mn2+ transporter
VTVAAVLLALVVTGAVSAIPGGAPKQRAVTRNIIGGSLALGITYAIGHVVGGAITRNPFREPDDDDNPVRRRHQS